MPQTKFTYNMHFFAEFYERNPEMYWQDLNAKIEQIT